MCESDIRTALKQKGKGLQWVRKYFYFNVLFTEECRFTLDGSNAWKSSVRGRRRGIVNVKAGIVEDGIGGT